MSSMKKIRKQVMVGQPLKMNHVVDETNKICDKEENNDSEEEDKVWKYTSDSLKDI